MRRTGRKTLPAVEAGSLFDLDTIPGLTYRAEYITRDEEAELIGHIDRHPWSLELQRRRQWYGWAYDDSPLGEGGDYAPQPMHDWLSVMGRKLCADGWFAGVPDRALVNDYQPGQGIGAHRDRDVERIKSVAIISLGSGIMMDFARAGFATRCQYLQPRSLVIMRGEAREQWTHGIIGRLNDKVGGLVLPRSRRMSLTFRHVAGAET